MTISQFTPVNVGSSPNDGTGDNLRVSFTKVNNNFANIASVGLGTANIVATGQVNITNQTNATNIISGALTVAGGMGVVKDVYIGGNLTIQGTQTVTNRQTVLVSEMIAQNLNVGYVFARTMGANGNISSNSVSTGSMVIEGGAGISENLNVGGTISGAIVASSIDGTPIGATTPSTAVFTDVAVDTLTITSVGGAGTMGNTAIPGSLDNMDIGLITPGLGNFTDLQVQNDAGVTGNLTATGFYGSFFGDGSGITGVMAISNYNDGNVAAYLPTHTGNVSANYIFGDGSFLTGIGSSYNNANVAAYLPTYAGNIGGTLTNSSQPNITSVGVLSSVSVSGNVDAVYFIGDGSLLTGITSSYGDSNVASYLGTYTGNLSGDGSGVTNVPGATNYTNANVTAYLPTHAGNVSANYFIGDGSLLTGITSSYGDSNVASYLGTYTGNISVSNITNAGADGTGNIGSPTTTFNTVFAMATTAQYADLAEKYEADAEYEPGTVVVFGGEKEITASVQEADVSVAGVVSATPAYVMNMGLIHGTPVALRGRVPVKVVGLVKKGDLLVSSAVKGAGMSVRHERTYGHAVFAKALEDKNYTELGVIEAVIV